MVGDNHKILEAQGELLQHTIVRVTTNQRSDIKKVPTGEDIGKIL